MCLPGDLGGECNEMTSVLVLALTWVIAASDAAPFCTWASQRSSRPRDIMELTLRATPDSVRDTHRSVGARELGHRRRRLSDTTPVFAQIFELVTADGDLGPLRPGRHRRVALVWWNLGMACDRALPGPAVHRDIDERRLFRWADADPRRWSLYPAVYELCGNPLIAIDTPHARPRCGP